MQNKPDDKRLPDWPVFLVALNLLVLVCIPLFLSPERSQACIQQSYDWMTTYLGILYLWGAVGVLAFCIWITASRRGAITLGDRQ